MTLLLDTHLLIWAAQDRLSPKAARYILDVDNTLLFSPASIWEIIIKNGLHRPDFNVNPTLFRPYVQAFFLIVSYDRTFYNPEYVLLEAKGVRAAGRGGMTYWNNLGRYDDIPLSADLDKTAPVQD
ncbi:hypothetical protein FACS1894147_02940 [Spirochaetia bacterium]|nr:hypothetical protein FACS1894147_02940 [Spirochaetia bacterium]